MTKIRARCRRYHIENRDKIHRYYIENRVKILDRKAEHREQINARVRARRVFLTVLEEEFDPAALQRQRTREQRDYDRRVLYQAAREELGADFCNAFLAELKQEELNELEKEQADDIH